MAYNEWYNAFAIVLNVIRKRCYRIIIKRHSHHKDIKNKLEMTMHEKWLCLGLRQYVTRK